jgi:hypothetical protein
MSESHKPIRVTAQERSHVAVRKLARACIAIARQQLCTERRSEAGAQLANQEVTHD